MRLVNVPWIHVHFEHFLHPRKKSGQFLSTELVATTANDDVSVFAEIEVRVAEAPYVQTLCFIGAEWRRIGVNDV